MGEPLYGADMNYEERQKAIGVWKGMLNMNDAADDLTTEEKKQGQEEINGFIAQLSQSDSWFATQARSKKSFAHKLGQRMAKKKKAETDE